MSELETLAERSLAGWPGHRLGDELKRLRRMGDVIELEFSRVAVAFAGTDEYERNGYDSPLQSIRENCNVTGYAGASALAVGEQRSSVERSVDAMRRGEIGFGHLALIARTAEAASEAGLSDRFPEDALLAKARQHTVNRFRRDCTHVRHSFDAQALRKDHVDLVDARFLTVMPRDDGAMWLRGFLDPEAAASLTTALAPLARKDGPADCRTRDKRHADALVELVRRSLDAGTLPRVSGQRPHLQVTTTLETLLGLSGSPAGELQHGAPVPVETVQRIACDSSVTRILLGPDSVITDVGRALRVPGPATRRALLARDRGCVWPGCTRTVASVSAHHIVHWAHGGGTDIANLVLLCSRHHWLVHEGGWQLAKAADGGVAVHEYGRWRPLIPFVRERDSGWRADSPIPQTASVDTS